MTSNPAWLLPRLHLIKGLLIDSYIHYPYQDADAPQSPPELHLEAMKT